MWRYIMAFIHNYQIEWLATDIIFVSDTIANGIWGSKYYEFFTVFGFKGAAVNTAVSTLELIRIGILLYQRGIQRQAQRPESGALHDKKKLRKDK